MMIIDVCSIKQGLTTKMKGCFSDNTKVSRVSRSMKPDLQRRNTRANGSKLELTVADN